MKPADTAKAEPTAESGAEAAKPAKSGKISPVTLIVAALVSFVVFLGIFSYTMGVFDSAPEPAPASADEKAAADAPTGEQPGQYYSPYGQAAAQAQAALETGAVDTMAEVSLLERRKRELAKEEAAIEAQKRELNALKAEVEQLLVKKQKIAEEKVSYIAKLIDGMKPDEMSGLIENLDNTTILAVLPVMKPQTAARVLSLLPPKRAAQITQELLYAEPRTETP